MVSVLSTVGHGQLPPHLGGRLEHGADDLVVAGAAAQIAGQPVAHLGLGRVRVALQQRLGGDQEARRADAALQRRMLEELAAAADAARRRSAMPSMVSTSGPRPRRQHQAGADQPAVEHDAAGAAVAGGAAFLGAGQRQLVAQHVEQRLLGLAQKLDRIAVDGGGDVNLGSSARPSPARARSAAGAPRQHARDLDPVFDGAALVVDRLAGGRRPPPPARRAPRRRPACRSAPPPLLDQQHRRRHRAERDPRRRADAGRRRGSG